MSSNAIVIAVFLAWSAFCAAAGALADHRFNGEITVKHEESAPEQRQKDSSLVLGKTVAPDIKPAVSVPRGTSPKRRIDVVIQPAAHPRPTAATPAECSGAADTFACPPVTARVVLTQKPDGKLNAVAVSPDGQVIGGQDYVLGDLVMRDAGRRWAAGLSFDPLAANPRGTAGVLVQRDVWRIRLGAEVFREDAGGGKTTIGQRVSALWVF